jgi:hypothetical protein
MKIAVVGADGRKWHPKQIPTLQAVIRGILLGYEVKPYVKGDSRVAYYWIYGKGDEIVLVSGHCPVGEERWYCVDCQKWLYSEGLAEDEECYLHKRYAFADHRLVKVFDKGGVDTWAEIIATELGIKKEIYLAEVYQWNDKIERFKDFDEKGEIKTFEIVHKGYRSRNIQIAKACDVLYDIEPKGSCSHCGGEGKKYKIYGIHPNGRDLKEMFEECKWCKGTGVYSGGTWTMKYAEKLGKEVYQIVIS